MTVNPMPGYPLQELQLGIYSRDVCFCCKRFVSAFETRDRPLNSWQPIL